MADETKTADQIGQEIADKIKAIHEGELTDGQRTAIAQVVDEKLETLQKAEPNGRKIAFGGSATGGDPLAGTKFGRMGLTPADMEFAGELLEMRERRTGERAMSDEARNVLKAVREAAPALRERAISERRQRNIGTDQTGSGDEMIADTLYGSTMMSDTRAVSRVASLIPSFPMQGPVQTLPVRAAFPTPILASESQGDASKYAAQDINSNRVTVTAKKLVWRSIWPTEIEEDSLFAFAPFARSEMSDSHAFHLDALVLRGDTTDAATGNINSDDADPAATTWFLAWDGIAHIPLVDNTTDLGVDAATTLTYGKLTAMRGAMYDKTYYLDWGHPNSPSDLIYVADPETAEEIADLDELVTVQNYATKASVLTGQVSMIGMNPLISSAALGRGEADGKISATASNNTLGRVLAFNRNGFALGVRRAPRIATDSLVGTDQVEIVMTARYGFGIHSPTGANSGSYQAEMLFNI